MEMRARETCRAKLARLDGLDTHIELMQALKSCLTIHLFVCSSPLSKVPLQLGEFGLSSGARADIAERANIFNEKKLRNSLPFRVAKLEIMSMC
jgi:hypothetical protein